MQHLVGAETRRVLETRFDHQRKVSVAALQTVDDVAAAQRRGKAVRHDIQDRPPRVEAGGLRRAGLQEADHSVAVPERTEHRTGQAAILQEVPRRIIQARAVGHRDRRTAGDGLGRRRRCAEGEALGHGPAGRRPGSRHEARVLEMIERAGADVGVFGEGVQRSMDERLSVRLQRVSGEIGDDPIEPCQTPRQHGFIAAVSQRQGAHGGGGLDKRELARLIARVTRAVDLEQSDRLVAQAQPRSDDADGLGRPAARRCDCRGGFAPRQEPLDRLSAGDDRRESVDSGGIVDKALGGGRLAGCGHEQGHGPVRRVIRRDVACESAELGAQAFAYRTQQAQPIDRTGRVWRRHDHGWRRGDRQSHGGIERRDLMRRRSAFVARNKVAGLSRKEFGEHDVGAGEGARSTALRQLHDAGDAPRADHRQRQDGPVTAPAIGLGSRRRHQVRSVEIGDDHASARAQHLAGDPVILRAGRSAVARQAVAAVVAGDDEGVIARRQQEPAGAHTHAVRSETRHRGERSLQPGRLPALGVARLVRDVERRVAGGLRAKERLNIATTVPAVTAGTAVAGELACIAPAPQCVDADAEERRRLTQAQPAISVRATDPHVLPGSRDDSEVHQF